MKENILDQIFSIKVEDDIYIIYAPLKGISFLGNASLINSIVDYDKNIPTGNKVKIFKNLEDLGFFNPEPEPESVVSLESFDYDSLILLMTNQCNLNCIYCSAYSETQHKKTMEWDVAGKSIDYILNLNKVNKKNCFNLYFYGNGEPTLNWDVLVRSVQYAQEQTKINGIDLSIGAVTNLFFNESKLNYIIQNFSELSVSFDGIENVQNIQRPSKNNKDSFATIFKNLQALDNVNFPYGLRLTVNNHSIKYLNESIEFIDSNLKAKRIHVEPVFPTGKAYEPEFSFGKDLFIKNFLTASDTAKQKGIEIVYSGAGLNGISGCYCSAPFKSLIVNPDGNITTCYEVFDEKHDKSKHFMIGGFQENKPVFNEDSISNYILNKNKRLSECKDCFLKWHCAGDCDIKSVTSNNFEEKQKSERCMLNQELSKELLLKNISDSGGLICVNNQLKGVSSI